MNLKLAPECTDRYELTLDSGSRVYLTRDELRQVVAATKLFTLMGDTDATNGHDFVCGADHVRLRFDDVVLVEKCDPNALALYIERYLYEEGEPQNSWLPLPKPEEGES